MQVGSTLFDYLPEDSTLGLQLNYTNEPKSISVGTADEQLFLILQPLLFILIKFATIKEARKREVQVKGWTRLKKEALVRGDIETLKKLSKRRKK